MSEVVEDYLKAIYKLHADSGKVSTSAIAGQMGVTPPSVTNMISRLAELGFLRHDRYHGVELTEMGARAALEVIRHHRLWELFLTEALEVPLERVHEEAERLEHILSDDLEEHLDRALGHPTVDPHGDPIPTKEGTLGPEERHTLADLEPGTPARVERVPDSDPGLLRYLREIDLVPGRRVRLVSREPFGGPYFLDVEAKDGSSAGPVSRVIGRELALRIFVAVIPSTPEINWTGGSM